MRAAAAVAAGVVPVAVVALLGAGFAFEGEDAAAAAGIDLAAVPPLARELLPDLSGVLERECPELPTLWVVAQVQAESSWDPRAVSPVGAAGLLQLRPATWREAGGPGGPWPRGGPAGHPVLEPRTHLRVAVRWMCRNLRAMAAHLAATGKPADPLEAMAVCHIAGCSRVTGSATGIPRPGDAGCGTGCAAQVRGYLASIRHWMGAYAAPVPGGGAGGWPAPAPFPGGPGGCAVPDPTGTGGCVTAATAWLLRQVAAVHTGPVACWDAHAWSPASDHPRGRACDYPIGRLGRHPTDTERATGWALAEWLRAHASRLRVAYLIWQGRIWTASRAGEGWRPYTGGGVYDPGDTTGGHYDHIHVSLTQ